MLDHYFKCPRTLVRFRSSAVGTYIDGYANVLRESGHSWQSGRSHLRYAVQFGTWARGEGIEVRALDDRTADRFEAQLRAGGDAQQRISRRRLRAAACARGFMDHLRRRGVVAPVEAAVVPTPPLIAGFCDWMRQQRGVTIATECGYRRVAVGLLASLGDDPARYDAGVVRKAVFGLTRGYGLSHARNVAKVARAYLRYLALCGKCRPGLDAAVPRVARWSLPSLPRYVSAADVQRLIGSCSPSTSVGARDRAVLLLLARLGLRAGDVVGLRLSDIYWNAAAIRVSGKGRREAWLPLSQEVGDAILSYLDGIRPLVPSDRVFLTARAPYGPLADSSAVSMIVARAVNRARVPAPTRGAHLLRHSAAVALLRDGVSLPAIGAVLRHRSPETTAHYAKMDIDLLRSVAQPWPGGASC